VHYMAHHTNLVVQPLSGLKKKILIIICVQLFCSQSQVATWAK
jgi:hypothetical protein